MKREKKEMVGAIQIEKIGGLKCDNPGCDWKDDSIRIEDYESWLNKPCPKCGCNVLTEYDYNHFKSMMKVISLVNKFIKVPANQDEKNNIRTELNYHGDNTTTSHHTVDDSYKPQKMRFFSYKSANKDNSKWLSEKLTEARRKGVTKHISELSRETLEYILYGYDFIDDQIYYFFYSTPEELNEIRKQYGFEKSGIKNIHFKMQNQTIYDSEEILKACTE